MIKMHRGLENTARKKIETNASRSVLLPHEKDRQTKQENRVQNHWGFRDTHSTNEVILRRVYGRGRKKAQFVRDYGLFPAELHARREGEKGDPRRKVPTDA